MYIHTYVCMYLPKYLLLRLRSKFWEKPPCPSLGTFCSCNCSCSRRWRWRRLYICLMKSRRSHRFVWEALWFTYAHLKSGRSKSGRKSARAGRQQAAGARPQQRGDSGNVCAVSLRAFRGRLALSFLLVAAAAAAAMQHLLICSSWSETNKQLKLIYEHKTKCVCIFRSLACFMHYECRHMRECMCVCLFVLSSVWAAEREREWEGGRGGETDTGRQGAKFVNIRKCRFGARRPEICGRAGRCTCCLFAPAAKLCEDINQIFIFTRRLQQQQQHIAGRRHSTNFSEFLYNFGNKLIK